MPQSISAKPATAETVNGLQNDRLGGAIYPADTPINSALQARRDSAATFAWRDYLQVHPAADDYPLLKDSDPSAFRELVEDIRKHGLRANIVLCGGLLLDGRNRLDALAELGVLYDIDGELGLKSWASTKWADLSGSTLSVAHCSIADGYDPYALAASLNVHRRHLTSEERRARIEAAIKRDPEKSDRAIGAEVGRDHKTVGGVRREMEDVGSIPHVEARTDSKGRKQPAKKKQVFNPEMAAINAGRRAEYAANKERVVAADDRQQEITIEDDLEPDEYRTSFLMRTADALAFAVYSGPIDNEVIAAAKRVAAKWQDFAQTLEAKNAINGGRQ